MEIVFQLKLNHSLFRNYPVVIKLLKLDFISKLFVNSALYLKDTQRRNTEKEIRGKKY